ncbi:MAG TPA: hypothetical protein VN442_05160 [Bryobacteraceae bacterium]|nr:hypothetical protein [Bryobacteraceae bacterium]
MRPRLREAVTTQDGHTHGEQALYATLCRLARPAPGRTGLRALTVGERTLAAEVPMAYSTCQQNLRSLITKLALEVRAGGANRSKTYLVYSFDEILRRRRAVGLTHVVRRTSGVTLVNPATCSGALTSGALDQGDPRETFSAPAADAPLLPSGAPGLRNSGAPGFNPHIRSQESSSGTSTEEEAPAALVQALREGMGTTDDDAVRRIFADSRAKAPDATVGEVAHFIRVQAARIGRLRGIENPMGLLIRQVPRCFEGESFRQFREAERQRREAERRQAEEVRLEAEQLLRDPGASEADRQWARMLLEENQT